MTVKRTIIIAVSLVVTISAAIPLTMSLSTVSVAELKQQYHIPSRQAPAAPQLEAQRVALGKALFFDPRLSGSNWISCATCHNPARGWSDGLPTAIGNNQQVLTRATPTLTNAAFNKLHMWDGRFRSLEKQALSPIESPDEMNQDLDELVAEIKAVPAYDILFSKAFPEKGISKSTIGQALASFERTIIADDTPFDKWIAGDETAINPNAQDGFKLFNGKANCSKCHLGFNFSDDGFHNIGLKNSENDAGRYAIRPIAISLGAFKTPTLRNITKTGPYMHNGIYTTLAEVIDHYDRGGDIKSNLSPNITPLNLSKTEKMQLMEFLKTLSSKAAVTVTAPDLPQQYLMGKESER